MKGLSIIDQEVGDDRTSIFYWDNIINCFRLLDVILLKVLEPTWFK